MNYLYFFVLALFFCGCVEPTWTFLETIQEQETILMQDSVSYTVSRSISCPRLGKKGHEDHIVLTYESIKK